MSCGKFFKRISFVLLLSLANLPAYSGKEDFGGIWSDTLNFTHKTPQFHVRTGPKGNLKSVDGKNFDIDEVHKGLKDSVDKIMKDGTGKDHNVVVAGITIVMRLGDNQFEVAYEPLKEEAQTLAFISGSVERKYNLQGYKIIGSSQSYTPTLLLENFGTRLNTSTSFICKKNRGTLSKYHESWKLNQKEELEKAIKSLINEANSKNHVSFYSLANGVNKILDEGSQGTNSGAGSFVDSEQYLLSYLNAPKEGLIKEQKSNIIFRFESLLPKYKTDKLLSLRKDLSKKLNTEDTKKMREITTSFLSDLDAYDKSTVLGYIFHLHSTNELCCCCAFSIAEEFFYKALGMQLTRENETPPFIFVTASASQAFGQGNNIRQGIGLDNKLEENDYETVDGSKAAVIKSNILLQKLFSDENKKISEHEQYLSYLANSDYPELCYYLALHESDI